MLSPLILAFLGIGGLGFGELLLISVVAIVLFGGRLPEVARNAGQYYANFRRQLADIQASFKTDIDLNIPAKLEDFSDVNVFHDDDVDDFDPPPEDDFDPPPSDQDPTEAV